MALNDTPSVDYNAENTAAGKTVPTYSSLHSVDRYRYQDTRLRSTSRAITKKHSIVTRICRNMWALFLAEFKRMNYAGKRTISVSGK